MPVERLIIKVEANGTRRVERDLRRVGSTSKESSRGVDLLRTALLALGGTAIIRGLFRTIDTFARLQNRLRVVTDGADELLSVQNRLAAVANETRASFEGNVEVFSRLAQSTKALGVDQETLLNLTRSLNQAVALSGAATQEARAGLIQLAQGLASGQLRGEELRSVLEQIPIVADVIADSLGKTRGELREFAETGGITTEVVLRAFREAREELGERFARTIATPSQALQILQNRILVAVGSFSQAEGVTQSLASAILFLANNVERFARLSLTAGVVVALNLTVRALNAVRAAVLRNPLFFAGALATGALALLVEFRDEIQVTEDGITSLGDVARAVFEELAGLFAVLREAGRGFLDFIVETWNGVFQDDLPGSFLGFAQGVATVLDTLIGVFSGVGAVIAVAFSRPLETAGFLIVETVNFIIRQINNLSRFVSRQIRALIDNLIQIAAAIPGVGADIANQLADIGGVALPEIGELQNQFEETGRTLGEAFTIGFESSTQASDAVTRIAQRAEEIGRRRVTTLEEQDQAQKSVNDSVRDSAEAATFASRAWARFDSNMEKAALTAEDFADDLSGILLGAVDRLSGALADLAISGFQSFEDFKAALSDIFRDIAREIIKLVIRFLILRAVSAAFGGAAGGGGGAGSTLATGVGSAVGSAGAGLAESQLAAPRQRGGPVGVNQTVLVGERGPELFTPGTMGTIQPNAATVAQPEVNLQVVNVRSEDEIPAAVQSKPGQEAVLNVLATNPRRVSQIVRQGGA